jgi:phosphoribosylformylglycinamidine cyclo-ligase
MTTTDAYARAGVDQGAASEVGREIRRVLRLPEHVLRADHFANVVPINETTGIALCTDGVGTKLVIAQELDRYDTVGIDCVAMNVNDLICVGARPVAMLDYIAVEVTDARLLLEIAQGMRRGADLAGIDIVGGELSQIPEIVSGFDLVGSCFGVVSLDSVVTGDAIRPGDPIIGLPSSGLHSNGYTLARKALHGVDLSDERLGRPLADILLEPTEIYVPAILDLLDSTVEVRGLAHITSSGQDNLKRLNHEVRFDFSEPFDVPAIFRLIQQQGDVSDTEMYEVFNMGCGFCCIVAADDEGEALEVLRHHYPAAKRVGRVAD